MSGLKLKGVRKSFGDVHVIHGVDLDVNHGEFVVFVGPSGCGKSTLLRLIAGLEDATGGRIEIGGEDVTGREPSDRGIAMVFQSYALYPHMTVRENMGFGLRMNGAPAADIATRVNRAASILHLDKLMDRRPKQLSGGQRQRVAIGRAIVREPKVFLFDEPLSNLDAELRVEMRLEIAKLHKELGATMIYVTHDQVEAMTLADKIVVLRSGKVEQVGSPMKLYDDPDNVFVAGFIGSPRMNFLPGKVKASTKGKATVALPGLGGATAAFMLENPPASGADVTLGIRPEHFHAAGKTRFTVDVDVVENLGGTAFAYANANGGDPLTIEMKADRSASEGKPLKTGFDPEKAFLFDAQTGARLR
jgi:lactose/L-arabinose transport system ATP-binding protein